MAGEERFLDYNRSFFWFTINDHQMTRILIKARVLAEDCKTGVKDTFFLVTACQGERMWEAGRLIQDPAYEFLAVVSETEMVMHRVWATHDPGRAEEFDYKLMYPYFNKVSLNLRSHDRARPLLSPKEQTDAIKGDRLMVGRTRLKSADGRYSALMEYPVETVNLLLSNHRVQMDTGPVLAPVWADEKWPGAVPERMIEQYRQAFIVYNQPTRTDMTLRTPTETGKGVKVMHYSHYLSTPAVNELYEVG